LLRLLFHVYTARLGRRGVAHAPLAWRVCRVMESMKT